MSEDIANAIKEAIEKANPNADVKVSAPLAPVMPPHVAANIFEMLKRVQVTGPEAYALTEAFETLKKFAAPAPTGPGVPFKPAA